MQNHFKVPFIKQGCSLNTKGEGGLHCSFFGKKNKVISNKLMEGTLWVVGTKLLLKDPGEVH